MKVCYSGPLYDYSGYGEANRHDVGALIAAGVDVTAQIPRYSLEISEYGKLGQLAQSIENKKIGYKIKIIHTTPNVYKQFYEPGVYHIGRVFWETNKLPPDFAQNCQYVDEIWTGSEFNAQAIRNAGVEKPIHIIPEAIDTEVDEELKPYIIENANSFKFYSIFEWTERKNPVALLQAYWQEFKPDENVSLTIKTYVDNFTPDKRQEVMNNIKQVKKRLALDFYAPVFVFRNLMDRRQIYRFHKTFDCFVSAHRGEGWGIPQMEAMLMEKPVISTNCGGIHEYLTDKKEAMLIPYKLIPIVQNTRNQQWYCRDQQWADVDISELQKAMRWVFEHQDQAKAMGISGKSVVDNSFSLIAVGSKMKQRLIEISKVIEKLP